MKTRHRYIIINGDISRHDVSRKITVVDGQPFYESTGVNSGHAGIWFPFVMMKGTVPITNTPDKYHPEAIKKLFGDHSPLDATYFFKYEASTLADSYSKEEFKVVLEGRIPDKTTLLTSLRLTPSSCPSRQVLLTYPCLSDIDIIETSNLICLADEPDFETIDPDKANRWLIDAGAKDIADFFTESLTQPLEDECNLTTPRISLFSRSSSCNENKRQRASTTGNLDYQFKRN